jgi:hypothetical protein
MSSSPIEDGINFLMSVIKTILLQMSSTFGTSFISIVTACLLLAVGVIVFERRRVLGLIITTCGLLIYLCVMMVTIVPTTS